ncbi:MAG: SEC-C domain-containing protein, partial [Thermoleophilia bacterium]|nr:SEC-C domain-containing protein [Thermoleophilia bacterium]
NVLKYDDVLNIQRQQVYADRREVLEGADLRDRILGWLAEEIETAVAVHCPTPYPDDWELEELWKLCTTMWPLRVDRARFEGRSETQVEEIEEALVNDATEHYERRERDIGADTMREVERVVFLQVLDTRWREHLDNMDYLRDGIGLRGLAQKNPLNEYQAEGYEMFQELMASVKSEAVNLLLRIEVDSGSLEPKAQRALDSGGSNARQPEVGEGVGPSGSSSSATGGFASTRTRSTDSLTYGTAAAPTALQEARTEAGLEDEGPVVQQRRVENTVGRNEPCPCGSGKKYKNCHGR